MKTKTAKFVNVLNLILFLLLTAASSSLEAKQKFAKGMVFEDTNRNGIFDKGEKGIPGVSVSNQADVVQTDAKGRYRLPVGKEAVLFVSKPAGYQVTLDKNNIPRFYYIHQPAGSPAGLKFKGIAPTGKLPKWVNFPLVKEDKMENFSAIIMGDPQTRSLKEISYYRDDVVAGLINTKARLYLALGDIMYDDLSFYDQMNSVVGQIGIPAYHVMGNHDMNPRVTDYMYEAETFKRIYGPDYYSFNYGRVHFVVLNSVKYKGWNQKEDKRGGYIGYVHERQLEWLKNDLSFVPKDHLVILAMHIPIISYLEQTPATTIINRSHLFKLLENRQHLLVLAGHMHFVEYMEFTAEDGWQGKAVFPSLTAGAGCGTWWHGLKDPWGIPYGIGTDGTPNGYFLFTFKGNTYTYRFVPARSLSHDQMRINSPSGTLSQKELSGHQINVNVFAGTPRTEVTYRLNNGPVTGMTRKIMKDPFFEKLVKENPGSFMDWMEAVNSSHIWTAPLPDNLQPGLHRLEITVRDQQGNVFTAYRLFEMK
jgi:hypothetical protein